MFSIHLKINYVKAKKYGKKLLVGNYRFYLIFLHVYWPEFVAVGYTPMSDHISVSSEWDNQTGMRSVCNFTTHLM